MYQYSDSEKELIKALRSPTPDFNRAKELIQKGVDINAGDIEDYSILYTETIEYLGDELEKEGTLEEIGNALVNITRFFLENGFDVSKCERKAGALALWQLLFSVETDHIIEAAKLLLDAGADSAIRLDPNENETVEEEFYIEGDFHIICEWNKELGNLFLTAGKVLTAKLNGQPYHLYFDYRKGLKKTIRAVYHISASDPITSKQLENIETILFGGMLAFDTADGFLCIDDKMDLWFYGDALSLQKTDISHLFSPILNKRIDEIDFQKTEWWGEVGWRKVLYYNTFVILQTENDRIRIGSVYACHDPENE